MKLARLGMVALSCLGFAMAAHANEVLLKANQKATITFKVAHKNLNNVGAQKCASVFLVGESA